MAYKRRYSKKRYKVFSFTLIALKYISQYQDIFDTLLYNKRMKKENYENHQIVFTIVFGDLG